MTLLRSTILIYLISILTIPVWAQVKTPTKPYKPPVFRTVLAGHSGKDTITKTEALYIIEAPLRAFDNKKKEYKISSYQFLYRQITLSEDEQTGQIFKASSISADLFKVTPLPALWIDKVKENLQPGEELLLFDIIVKDEQGRVMYAPDISITIK